MKAKEVLEKLNITRPTLTKYVKEGLIKVDSCINGQYNYNEESVNKLLNTTTITINECQGKLVDVRDQRLDLLTEAVRSCYNIFITILNQLSH